MKIRDIVVEKAIVPNMVAVKRDDAIRELLDAMVSAGKVSADMRDSFAKAIIARENKGSTPVFPVHTPEADANAESKSSS